MKPRPKATLNKPKAPSRMHLPSALDDVLPRCLEYLALVSCCCHYYFFVVAIAAVVGPCTAADAVACRRCAVITLTGSLSISLSEAVGHC